ncbi:MAG: hypothetical protein GVY13_01370 [Alphaproteobacteria bacterium]|jgi:hypothetical protein|nr:hypothetical protein [Alphaproteobacteria bacterium]
MGSWQRRRAANENIREETGDLPAAVAEREIAEARRAVRRVADRIAGTGHPYLTERIAPQLQEIAGILEDMTVDTPYAGELLSLTLVRLRLLCAAVEEAKRETEERLIR